MIEEAVIKTVLDEAFHVHKKIGPGMWESVYKTCVACRLIAQLIGCYTSILLKFSFSPFFECEKKSLLRKYFPQNRNRITHLRTRYPGNRNGIIFYSL